MIITSLGVYKGTTYVIDTDDGRKFYLHADIVADYGLRAGIELDRAKLREIIYASNFRRAYQYAMYRLDYREHSAKEMLGKLVRTYKNEALCSAVVDKLISGGFIDDKRYAERLAQKYVVSKKYGRRRAEREMILKGIDKDTAGDALEKYEDVYAENLESLLETKYARFLADSSDIKTVSKAKNALVRYGYGFDEINRAVREYFENSED